MATSSAPSAGRQNSRFSSLKVFKIASSSSKAPQPPPKDPYYLANPSLVSLSQSVTQDSSSSMTPISSRYAASARSPSPSPSYSTSHYAPSTTALSPSAVSSTTLSPDSAGSKKGLFKLPSFARRSKTPKSSRTDPIEPPETADDPSISLPWNFQHNIHVDEGFAGLPPSWNASLVDLGFSSEEIALISAKRAASRSPTLTPLHTQGFHMRNDSTTSSGFSHYQPRSSSLQRGASDDGSSLQSHNSRQLTHPRRGSNASRTQSEATTETGYDQTGYTRPSPLSPEAPTLRVRTDSPGASPLTSSPSRMFRSVTPSIPSTPSSPVVRSPEGTPQAMRAPFPTSPLRGAQGSLPPSRTHSPAPYSGSSSMSGSEKDRPPRTPPRRLHVTNSSIATLPSPPPAYRSPKRSTVALGDDSDDIAPPPEDPEPDTEPDASDSEEIAALPNTGPRLPTAPPRLSLHQDDLTDLSSWTESLFSIIPAEDKTSTPAKPAVPPARSKPRSTTSSPQPPATSSSYLSHSSNKLSSSPPSTSRQTSSQIPPPLNQLPARGVSRSPSPARPDPASASSDVTQIEERTTPLFNEVMNMVNSDRGLESDDWQMQVPYKDKENRDSGMSTMTVTPATIVRDVAIATRARANVIQSPVRDNGDPKLTLPSTTISSSSPELDDSDDSAEDRSNSPSSSESHSSGGSVAASLSTSLAGSVSALRSEGSLPYVESSPLPSPLAGSFGQSALSSSAVRQYRDPNGAGPSIVISDLDKVTNIEDSRVPSPYSASSAAPSPLSASPQYTGWVSEVVAPIRKFISERKDPRTLFADLQEIAEGESGSVYAARIVNPTAPGKDQAAIKMVSLVPTGTPKLADLERELTVLRNVAHSHILLMDALYLDLEDDALWIHMELMDRSLADVIALADEGILLQEKQIALVAKDVLSALYYLRKQGIAHRDVRSDNLLISPEGAVKLADFSNAVRVPLLEPTRADPAGVHFWQAPEVRRGPYNTLKVDVWSLGATVWEMAQTEPPFSDATDINQLGDRWPPLSQAEVYSRSFHDFLHRCSEPSSLRSDPFDLLNTPFIRNAGERSSLIQVLSQCRSIEMSPRRLSTDSHGTVS